MTFCCRIIPCFAFIIPYVVLQYEFEFSYITAPLFAFSMDKGQADAFVACKMNSLVVEGLVGGTDQAVKKSVASANRCVSFYIK